MAHFKVIAHFCRVINHLNPTSTQLLVGFFNKNFKNCLFWAWGQSSWLQVNQLIFNSSVKCGRLCLKCDGTRAETRFRLSAKRTSQFKSAGASVQSTAGSRGVRISGSNAGYTTFRGSVNSTCYPLHSPVSPSLPLPYVTACHHISTGLYRQRNIAAWSLARWQVTFTF